MKRVSMLLVLMCCMLVSISPAWSLLITLNGNTIDVGAVDTFIGSEKLPNSGDGTEINWVKSILNTGDVKLDAKYESMTWIETNQPGTFALHLVTNDPQYFLFKTGKVDVAADHFLFQNVSNLDWAVINLSSMGIRNSNFGKISHIDEFNDPPTTVPEPMSLILLGFGMCGVGIFRKLW